MDPGYFHVDRVMEKIGLEFHAFATSAGALEMKEMVGAEEELLAGTRQSHGTPINRWCKEEGSMLVGSQKVKLERQRLRTGKAKKCAWRHTTGSAPTMLGRARSLSDWPPSCETSDGSTPRRQQV